MTPLSSQVVVVASVQPCEHFGFRIELSKDIRPEWVMDFRRRALEDSNSVFMDCNPDDQSVARGSFANLAFTDSDCSPRDSSSKLIHLLMSLRMVELAYLHQKNTRSDEEAMAFGVLCLVNLGQETRLALNKFCEGLGIQLLLGEVFWIEELPEIGGVVREKWHSWKSFSVFPIKQLEAIRRNFNSSSSVFLCLTKCGCEVVDFLIRFSWCVLGGVHLRFLFHYQSVAKLILHGMNHPRNVFMHIDFFSRRNRKTVSYLRWKYGMNPAVEECLDYSVIRFSHLLQDYYNCSLSAMIWLIMALRRLRTIPLEGCVDVSFLTPPRDIFRRHIDCKRHCSRLIRCLRKAQDQSDDFMPRLVYGKFIKNLELGCGYSIEVSKIGKRFFERPPVDVVKLVAERIFTSSLADLGCSLPDALHVVIVESFTEIEGRFSSRRLALAPTAV